MNRKYEASFFEQRFRNRIYEAVIRALEQESKAHKWKRKDIAERIGKKESQISRWLAGPGNWTLDTVSNLLFALDSELDFKVTRFKNKTKKNEFHPFNAPLLVAAPQAGTTQGTVVLMPKKLVTATHSAGSV